MAKMLITKEDKARVIIAALYNLKSLPNPEDRRVKREARRHSNVVDERHKIALRVFEARQA